MADKERYVLIVQQRKNCHLQTYNIFTDGECDRESNVRFMHVANSDKPVEAYNLDVVIAVGYRVKSIRGVIFRKWAIEFSKIGKFDDDFRFMLSKPELEQLSISRNVTSIQMKGKKGGRSTDEEVKKVLRSKQLTSRRGGSN